MGAQRIHEILKENSAFGSLKARLDRLKPLQEALLQALPSPLHAHVQATLLDGPRLHVQVSSQAVAARLRLQSPSLIRHLRPLAPDISALQFHVAQPEATGRPHRPAASIPPEALAQFETLAGSLSPSPLKTAIRRLLQARGRSV